MWGTSSNDVCDFCPLDLRGFLHVELLCGDLVFFRISFVLTAHSKDYSVLLSCFALCRFNLVFHFVVFQDSDILLGYVLSSFMWLSFKMAFAGPR